jgi:hypothetical protein
MIHVKSNIATEQTEYNVACVQTYDLVHNYSEKNEDYCIALR